MDTGVVEPDDRRNGRVTVVSAAVFDGGTVRTDTLSASSNSN